ncbi:hypothetical protein J6590_039464 [Homalodisca vitripennis]|nr:hypothetical protein J6590_039464 [Homalodisca vitripennis]
MNTELILLSALSFFISFPDSLAARKPVFRFSTSDYRKILQTTGFVDKTLMIKNIIDKSGVALITAPPKFGKSTNLDMLKKFLEIEVDKDGHPKTRANLTLEPVMDTENYKLFVSNELKITENKTIMEEHFGKYPVINADFKCLNIVKTFDEAAEFFKYVIHNTFKQHGYLLNSPHLTNHQRFFFERWWNGTTYKEMNKQHITHGLRLLSVYLCKHFGRRAFVIIDDHDSIIGQSMYDVKSAEKLRKIIALSTSMIGTVLKNNDIFVKGGLITGVADMPLFGFSDLNSIVTYGFLKEHEFFNYYGLTKEETEELFKKPEFNLDPDAVRRAHEAYNGYQSARGKKIYNIYSVLRFLKTGQVKTYWTKYASIKKLRGVFKIPAFKQYIDKLASGKSISIVITDKLTVEDVIDLRNLLLRPQVGINYWPAVLFNFLFKLGYLTYMPHRHPAGFSVQQVTVKIPNTEVMEYIQKQR